MTVQEASEKWGISKSDIEILCSTNKIEGVLRIDGFYDIPTDASKPTYDKPISFYTRSYPKGDGSDKWIVVRGDYYLGGKCVATDFVECEEQECRFIEYQLSC